jgi:hypothetical protein
LSQKKEGHHKFINKRELRLEEGDIKEFNYYKMCIGIIDRYNKLPTFPSLFAYGAFKNRTKTPSKY